MRLTFWLKCAVVGAAFPLAALAACSSTSSGTGGSSASSSSGTESGSSSSSSSGTDGGAAAQTPPQGATAVKTWLAAGYYKSWHCQAAPHAANAPSPHSMNRICSNTVLATGSPPFAVGAAAVKELYPAPDAGVDTTKPFGYAVYLKTAADTSADGGNGSGANWYWYEDDPDFGGLVADGLGTPGTPPLTICVSCHTAANSDAAHKGAGDFVYVQVP